MNHAHFVSSLEHQTDSPDTTLPNAQPVCRNPAPVTGVGAVPHHLTDSEREAAIHRAGKLVEHYMHKWAATSDFQYRGDADRALRLQNLLIAGRSAEYVAKLEKERGLA